MKIITPPQELPKFFIQPSVFLGGSIEMGKAENWQDKLINEFKNIDMIVLNPRRPDWDISQEQSIDNPYFYGQVTWELEALDKTDIILMYFDPKTKSPISLLELGLYAESNKLFVCCPNGFWRQGNVEIVCQKYNIPYTNDLNNFITKLKKHFNKWNL